MNARTLFLGFAIGLRHGVDPEHLAVIDGVTRVRPSPWNGVLFGLGHGVVIMILAIGVGDLHLGILEAVAPWLLIAIGTANLWRLIKPASHPAKVTRVSASPLLLGALFAAGFESAGQLSALVLADHTNPMLLGLASSLGTLIVGGVDGVLASRTQSRAGSGSPRAVEAGRLLGVMVVISSFAMGGSQLLGIAWTDWALPMGIVMFAIVFGLRVWASSEKSQTGGGIHASNIAYDASMPPADATFTNIGNG